MRFHFRAREEAFEMPRLASFNAKLKNWVESPFWFWVFAFAFVICVFIFMLNAVISEIRPYNLWGLSYGTAAAVLMLAAAFLGMRRRTMRLASKYRLGKSQAWAQAHIYGGTIFLLLTLMHSGFRLPTGALTWWLWMASLWITLSGILGALLQKWIPKMLTSGLAVEVLYERIPELIVELREKAETLVHDCDEATGDFYRKNLAPAMAAPQPRLIYFVDITGGIQSRIKQFDYLRRFLPAEEDEKLYHLQALYKTKLEIDAHYTLQKTLHWWLYLHVPVSLILLVLVSLHIFAVLYY